MYTTDLINQLIGWSVVLCTSRYVYVSNTVHFDVVIVFLGGS